jgi:hypothetical protein
MSPQSWNRYSYVFNNPLVFVDPNGQFADFYDQNGNRLGNDGNNDGKVYVVTGKNDADAIKKAGKKGGTTQVGSVQSAIELPSFAAREEMGAAVDRSNAPSQAAGDQTGGFHEEGGIVGTTSNGQEIVIPAAPGPASDPRTDKDAHIDPFSAANKSQLNDLASATATYHVHPSGEIKESPKAPPGTVVIGGTEKTFNFIQPPSPHDISNAAQRTRDLGVSTNVVLGARDKKAYIYNGSGVRATLPLDRFRTVR